MAAYFRKRVPNTHDWTTGPYKLSADKVHPAYVPAVTDVITVTPLNYPTNGLSQTSAGNGNINCWVEWSGTLWKIHVSDATFTGVIQYRLKNVR